ncbi:MAG: hypothetical protein JNJ45_05085 [Chthonomonas sp.]|nr:hypothetical protein [Chthonomonas sp.]
MSIKFWVAVVVGGLLAILAAFAAMPGTFEVHEGLGNVCLGEQKVVRYGISRLARVGFSYGKKGCSAIISGRCFVTVITATGQTQTLYGWGLCRSNDAYLRPQASRHLATVTLELD